MAKKEEKAVSQENSFRDVFNFGFPMGKIFKEGLDTDIYNEGENIILKMAVPGYKKEDIEVKVEDDVLIIKGDVNKETEENKKNYQRKEIAQQTFEQKYKLPATAVAEKIEARCENGILTIIVPTNSKKERKINIEVKFGND